MSTTGCSYAQAARGQATPQTTTTLNTCQIPATDESGSSAIPTIITVPESSDTHESAKHTPIEANSITTRKVESDTDSATDSATLIETLNESASNISLDDAAFHVTKVNDVLSRATRPPSPEDITRQDREGKVSKASARDGDEPPTAEILGNGKGSTVPTLSPAPVPVKNIWEERRRELAAKSKQTNAFARLAVTSPTTGVSAKSKDMKNTSGSPLDLESNFEAGHSSSVTVKSQPRRSSEVSRTDQPRRGGPRGTRMADKEAKDTTTRIKLPPVQDAALWPTPDSATISEDQRTRGGSEKIEKDVGYNEGVEEGSLTKSRKKGAWVALDFVPTVNFQTPIPNVRGSKLKIGGRGGRDSSSRGNYNGVSNSTSSSDKIASMASLSTAKFDVRDGSKGSTNGFVGTGRAQLHPSNTTKRNLADSAHNREFRKSAIASDFVRSREDYPAVLRKASFASKGSLNGVVNNRESGSHDNDVDYYPNTSDKRLGPVKSSDHHRYSHRDDDNQQGKEHHNIPTRDKTEARAERPHRGGFRAGRGGHIHNSIQSHHFSRPTYQVNGPRVPTNIAFHGGSISTLPPSASPFTPSVQQYSFGANNGPRARGPGRNQAASQGQTSFTSRMLNGLTSSGRVLPHAMHSAGISSEFHLQQHTFAFPPYVENEQFYSLLVRQLEYYFSLENLCKDMFLRKKMDGQGFVPLSVVASFRRMAELAPSIDFIRTACEQSEKLDYIVDKDQIELIRSRHEWRKFVLPEEQRAEEARMSGPDMRTVQFRSLHSRPQQAYYHPNFVTGFPGAAPEVFSTQIYQTNGGELVYSSYDSTQVGSNGHANGRSNGSESQLSATVPDFSPASLSGAPMTLEDYQNCPDEQVEKLVVVVASNPEPPEAPEKSEAHDHSHRCQENQYTSSGIDSSLDTQTELQSGSVSKTMPPCSVVEVVGEESYAELRTRAFEQRRFAQGSETPVGMRNLYRFWCHCLVDKFNVRMYEDFRSSALDDARSDSPKEFGLRYLLQYYNRVLTDPSGSKPYPSVFVPHFTEARELYESRDAINEKCQIRIPS